MFFIIEKIDQLERLDYFDSCFVDFIPFNDNFHPVLQQQKISLVYVRSLNYHKGYMLCCNHSETLSLNLSDIFDYLKKKIKKIYVLNKKEALYYFPFPDKMYDISFIEFPNFTKLESLACMNFFYNKFTSHEKTNYLIPVVKHYEEKENIFNILKPIIDKHREGNKIYDFNNGKLTKAFFEIESKGIRLSKEKFQEYYSNIQYPEYNIDKSKIYTSYNLYTLTGRPSNSFNNINFAALNKDNGERECFIPENDEFVEYDINAMHPRIIGKLIEFDLPNESLYDVLGIPKDEMFRNIYGGIQPKWESNPFLSKIKEYVEVDWFFFQQTQYTESPIRMFDKFEKDIDNPYKLFNYKIMGWETFDNVKRILVIQSILSNFKSKLVLYTYDSFLIDYAFEDGKSLLYAIEYALELPFRVKRGKNYSNLD